MKKIPPIPPTPFNFNSKPNNDLPKLLNSPYNILSFSISSHGKTGVFFIETDQGSFVLKSTNEGPRDEFINKLGLMLNLSVPESVCLSCSDHQFNKIMFKMEKFCQKDETLSMRIKTKLDFPFYQILQYIPSVSLAEIGPERYRKWMAEQHKFYSLGMCLAFDLIINNSDRFKLVWGGEGNLSNVLIEVESHDCFPLKQIKERGNLSVPLGNFVFIDHEGHLLDLSNLQANNNFHAYLQKVTKFYISLIRGIGESSELPQEFNELSKQIELYSQYKLGLNELRQISEGIIYMTNNFLKSYEDQQIQNLYNSLLKHNQPDQHPDVLYWNNYWNHQLAEVKINYLKEMHTKLSAIFTTYPETIHQILNNPTLLIQNQIKTRPTPLSTPQQNNSHSISQISHQEAQNNEERAREVVEENKTGELVIIKGQLMKGSEVQMKGSEVQMKGSDLLSGRQQDYQQVLGEGKQGKGLVRDRKWRVKLRQFEAVNMNKV